mmetsp:Transcript_25353/g.73143  ORF Transcript_25353/g.73143 Transcript_25353/m.73143 type:complete len:207 (+) Transcript_25353:1513-2133(+)
MENSSTTSATMLMSSGGTALVMQGIPDRISVYSSSLTLYAMRVTSLKLSLLRTHKVLSFAATIVAFRGVSYKIASSPKESPAFKCKCESTPTESKPSCTKKSDFPRSPREKRISPAGNEMRYTESATNWRCCSSSLSTSPKSLLFCTACMMRKRSEAVFSYVWMIVRPVSLQMSSSSSPKESSLPNLRAWWDTVALLRRDRRRKAW